MKSVGYRALEHVVRDGFEALLRGEEQVKVLAGRRAFVTGVTSGIGAATGVLVAEPGAVVTALGLPPADPADLPYPRPRRRPEARW
ncbi:hypothetical protein [Streptomyces spongiae]|uniref:Uncharacterized protein n=1 Tax=Streptomyces spongiae TaxID=565072 RepID=A0A5N8XDK0_9ACTN|nr:hypothetical protein [Streptomyces spongiae]MPY57274.1 hypothetical protein [Streptomyces spongiae]